MTEEEQMETYRKNVNQTALNEQILNQCIGKSECEPEIKYKDITNGDDIKDIWRPPFDSLFFA